MESIASAPKDKAISFALSSMQSASDDSKAAADVLRPVRDGEITPIKANRAGSLGASSCHRLGSAGV